VTQNELVLVREPIGRACALENTKTGSSQLRN